MSSTIVDIRGRQILDSRGNPTVEVDVVLADGCSAGRRSPAGPAPACTRPGNFATATRQNISAGGFCRPSTTSTTKLADELCGMDALDQAALDQRMIELDGTRE